MEKLNLDRVTIKIEDFKKALEHEELIEFILWIENTYVESVKSVHELLERIDDAKLERISYTDDVGFEAYTLSKKLTKYNIPHEYKEN